MSRTAVIVLVVVGAAVAAGSCCLLGGAALVLGADEEAQTGGPGEAPTGPPAAGEALVGGWLDSAGPPEFFERLRAGERYETLGVNHVGEYFLLRDDGTCVVEILRGEPKGGCMFARYQRWEACRYTLQGDALVFTLGQGEKRGVLCGRELDSNREVLPPTVDRRRARLLDDGRLEVVDALGLTQHYRRVE